MSIPTASRFRLFFLIGLLPLTALPACGDEAVATNQVGNAFYRSVAANFDLWDTNHDQTLSGEELDAAIADPANKGRAAAALATLRRASSLTNIPPFTLANLRQISEDTNFSLLPSYNQFLGRIRGVKHRELFVSGLPQLTTIRQGRMGNCFTLAPLGALVNRDPHEVADWFEVRSNGNVLVKMPAGAIEVPPPTDAELAFGSGNSQDGVWINLYEKAIAEARNERKPSGKRFEDALDAIAKGGSEASILSYITGHKVATYSLRFRSAADAPARMDQLREKLAYATSNQLIMVCGTGTTTTPGLTPKHAYALLNYDANTDMVKLWNPHGDGFKPKGDPGLTNGYSMAHGILTLPLTDLTNQFHSVAIERSERTPLKWPDQWKLMAEAGRFDEAATDLSAVVELDESQSLELYFLTPLLVQTHRLAEYTNHCQAVLKLYAQTTAPAIAERTAKSCLLLPGALTGEDFVRVTNLAAQAVSLSAKGAPTHWRLMTRGLAEYRAGRYADALKSESRSQKILAQVYKLKLDADAPACDVGTHLITAMAHERLNDHQAAGEELDRALDLIKTKLPKLNSGDLGEGWFDTLIANILLREATGVVHGETAMVEKR